MERGKTSSTGRGAKSKGPQHPQDIFALGTKSTVVVSRDSEKRSIHKPSTSGVERKRETTGFGTQPPAKRSRIGSPAESVCGISLEVDPVDLVPNVLQALDTHNSDKLLGLLTGSIRLLKSQRSKPDPILCMSMLYLTKIRPNMFAHDIVTQSLCTLLKREQGAAFKSKGNPLVFVLACNMLYAGHKDSNNWPETFIKVYIEDALNERWWVECSWCKCLVENIVTAFNTKAPPPHLIPSDNTLGTMSPSGSGSPLMGSADEDADNTDLEYTVFPRYSTSYETVEALVLEAIKEQIQRRAAPDAIGKGFLKLLSATCGFPEIRMIAAARLEGWLHSGKLWRAAQQLLAGVCANAAGAGPSAARDHEVLAQLARMRLKTKPLQAAYQACLREMVSESPALLRSVVTHTIYNELSAVRSPNNMAVLCALIQAQPQAVPAAMAATYQELLFRSEDYLRPLRLLTRECVRAARADAQALLPLARALAAPPTTDPPNEVRDRAFASLADLFCCCCLVTASHSKHLPEYRAQLGAVQAVAVGWLLDVAVPVYRPQRQEYLQALNKIMFVEAAEAYSKADNWPPESERAHTHRLCADAPLPQNTLLRLIFIGLSKDIPVTPAEVLEVVEAVVRRAAALPPDDQPLHVDKPELPDYLFQLCQFHPPENVTLPAGYTVPPLAITALYWRAWAILAMVAAHNPQGFAERIAAAYPTLRALIETCITGKGSIEWTGGAPEAERLEAERAAVLQLEATLAAAGGAKLPVTEHTSRMLSQVCRLDPTGPARRPPPGIAESLSALASSLRLGRLLCRAPALLLALVERHGTRRAMPWLHHLLRHDQLELSVLPVQCLCEFLSAGAAGPTAEAGKTGELCAHLRRTVAESEQGARAVLHYYAARLAHHHRHTRQGAQRGLKLVLTQSTDEATEMDYNADVSPDDWLELLIQLPHWASLRGEVVPRLRAACLAECHPPHLVDYLAFLASQVALHPDEDHTDMVLDLSQVLMERTTLMGYVLPAGAATGVAANVSVEPTRSQHRALYALTQILYTHLFKLLTVGAPEEEEIPSPPPGSEDEAAVGGSDRVRLSWATTARAASMHLIVAHAHLKLLCYGPSVFDSNQEMYQWLVSMWTSPAPHCSPGGSAALLPDWLRLHLVRSARPRLLELGLRALPAHKLAIFIQTFGMPVAAMSALLTALDACPMGAVSRLSVERGYLSQLLHVQRGRGAGGGQAFAKALGLAPLLMPPDESLFSPTPLPLEPPGAWEGLAAPPPPLPPAAAAALLETAFGDAASYRGDLDLGCIQLVEQVTEDMRRMSAGVPTRGYVQAVTAFLAGVAGAGVAGGAGLLRRPAHAAPLLRALLPPTERVQQLASTLLATLKVVPGGVSSALRALAAGGARAARSLLRPDLPHVPPDATREQLIAALETATPSTLEPLGARIIGSQQPQLIVDVIATVLENSQDGKYETKVKSEDDEDLDNQHVFSMRGLGCGLLLDWLAELQRETRGPQPERQMRLMFVHGRAAWRPLLVTLLAHRASWATLHATLSTLLTPDGAEKWSAVAVLSLAAAVAASPRVLQRRERAPFKRKEPQDTLSLTNQQLEVLVGYVVEEASEASLTGGLEAARASIEARLPLLLRCCRHRAGLLAAALPAARLQPMLLLLLYMKVPKILQLLTESCPRPPVAPLLCVPPEVSLACTRSTSATDAVSHALLTTLAAAAAAPHCKENTQKIWRMEGSIRALWARVSGAGARALPLAGALVLGAGAARQQIRHQMHVLAALEVLPDTCLFAPHNCDETAKILECFLTLLRRQQGGGGGGGGGGGRYAGGESPLAHRLAALLRRYLAAAPPRAARLLHSHRDTISMSGALSALTEAPAGEGGPASSAPPPAALRALQRRQDPPPELAHHVQEIESWGVRRGGAWGGAEAARALLAAAAPLAASSHAPLRQAVLALLTKLLPAVDDTTPGLQALLECLDSSQPEIAQAALDKLPEIIVGIQEHAARLLTRVFELGVTSRHPVDTCLAKCVATLNLHRGC